MCKQAGINANYTYRNLLLINCIKQVILSQYERTGIFVKIDVSISCKY